MKNRLLPLFLVSILFSCTRTADIESVAMSVETPQQTVLPKISKDIDFLSADDVVKVANLFNHGNILTKSENMKEVRDVVPVMDGSGRTLMYAVNYDDGYDLISATKKYHPVLAMVEHGTYTGEKTNSGYDVIMNEYVEATQAAIDGKITIDGNPWAVYEEVPYNAPVQTKVSDAYTEVANEYIEDWYMSGYNIYQLNTKPENMPDDMYETFCDYARDYDRPDHDYMQCSFIVENNDNYRYQVGPYVQTRWGQGGVYNDALDTNQPLGCTVVAAGQIMKYLEHPANINWAAMSNVFTLSSFLVELRTNIGTNYNGTATIEDVRIALETYYGYTPTYGFSVERINHSQQPVRNSLDRDVPVFMCGSDYVTNHGHAWVCDGYYMSHPQTEYSLFVIPMGVSEIASLSNIYTTYVYPDSFIINYYYHMNWGWDGQYDGFYIEGAVSPSVDNYSSNRMELIITRL